MWGKLPGDPSRPMGSGEHTVHAANGHSPPGRTRAEFQHLVREGPRSQTGPGSESQGPPLRRRLGPGRPVGSALWSLPGRTGPVCWARGLRLGPLPPAFPRVEIAVPSSRLTSQRPDTPPWSAGRRSACFNNEGAL